MRKTTNFRHCHPSIPAGRIATNHIIPLFLVSCHGDTMMVLYRVVWKALEALIVDMEMRICPLVALKDGDFVGRCSSSVRKVSRECE